MIIELYQGDITELEVDAIVNAANTSLLGGGGVDGAIHRAAGPKLLEECRKFDGCNTGEAVITGAYNLQCKYVIHTPGPVWDGGDRGEPEKLKKCYLNSLLRAEEKKCGSIAFPSISTGIYGYPIHEAALIARETVDNWSGDFPQKVIFVTFSDSDTDVYRQILNIK
jgi:O-acetyl-ADP-ribose deacetylase (regulator of RNase III)